MGVGFARVRCPTFRKSGTILTHSILKPLLYLICGLTDFAGFIVIFVVSRGLAEQQVELWYLGVVGAAFSFSAGMASLFSGWLSLRFDRRVVFLCGCIMVPLAVVACGFGDTATASFLPRYCLLGMGFGSIYPTLIGWLNQDEDAHVNRRGVSRTLILYCVSWNVGMMCGQLTAGSLFDWGPQWLYGVAFGVAVVNAVLAILATRLVTRAYREAAFGSSVSENEPSAESILVTDAAAQETAGRFKRLSWIANLGGTFGGSLIFHLLPDLAVTIGVPADNHGGLLAFSRCMVIATYLLMHFAGFWQYRFSTSVTSQMLGIIGLLMIAQADSAMALFVGLALHGQLVGYNYFSGLFYSTAGSSREQRTMAAGIHEATLAAGMATGTVAGGVLGSVIGQRTPYLLAAAVLTVLVAVQITAWWKWFVLPGRERKATAAIVEQLR